MLCYVVMTTWSFIITYVILWYVMHTILAWLFSRMWNVDIPRMYNLQFACYIISSYGYLVHFLCHMHRNIFSLWLLRMRTLRYLYSSWCYDMICVHHNTMQAPFPLWLEQCECALAEGQPQGYVYASLVGPCAHMWVVCRVLHILNPN